VLWRSKENPKLRFNHGDQLLLDTDTSVSITVATKDSDYKVLTEAEIKARDTWIMRHWDDCNNRLSLYAGEPSLG